MRTKTAVCFAVGIFVMSIVLSVAGQTNEPTLTLMGNRFLTFSTLVRVNQIETTRDTIHGQDEASVHGPEEARVFREAVEKGFPGARITWGFSWLALKDQRTNYVELRKRVVAYHKQYGDEITFVPGGYFANMYNTREQVNRDLHEGLQMVSEMVGGGYRPRAVIAGFLAADNLRYLAEKENIHVCQGNIWSQYAVDNGDGEGSLCYPYYPSREHFCKPAQGQADVIDCVNLDGWTVDFLCGRIPGGRTVNGEHWRSRQGVGPIETLLDMGTERGLQAMLATTATHFDAGFERNGFGWVTSIWELGLVEGRKIYGYRGRNGIDGLVGWLTEIRRRWPGAQCITHGEFGERWRKQFKNNDQLDYRFVQRGCGIRASEADKEIRWFMNKDFRLALLRDVKTNASAKVIDFTRYDLPAAEPADPEPGKPSRNWSLMNRLNQKGVRPQDKPVPLQQLTSEEQSLIQRRYPELIGGFYDLSTPSQHKTISVKAAVDAPMGVERVARPTSRNYISPVVTNDDTVCWVQVDLGCLQLIDHVKVFPYIDWGWLGVNKTEFFPSRFKIEASDDPEFKKDCVIGKITDQTGADFANTEDAVLRFPGNSTAGRYVRLTATRLTGQKLVLMKIEVWSGGKNVAEGCPVADSFKGDLGVTKLTLTRRPQDEVVTDNPGNVIPADQWKPVAYKAQAPLGGVQLADGLFKRAMQNNIAYLMSTFTADELVREFRTRAGKPNPEGLCKPDHFWDTKLAGQNAGRFLMGAGNTLRWMDDPSLRKRMNEIVDVIEACRQPDGYIMAYPTNTIFGSERAGYTRAWVTHGLIEAGYAGNPKAFPLLRGFYDWFNHCPYLPELLRRPNQSQQGTIASTRVYFTPIGKAEDLQVVQRYFQENAWLEQLARRDTDAIWKYPYDRPHCYLLTAIEPYLDLYRATGKRGYFDAALGGWELYHDNWEHIGGAIAICEGGSYPPKSYIFRCTGELCGSVFMARLSQRFHLLDPEQEKFVGEIEKTIYNSALPNQNADKGILYHVRMVGHKDESPCNIGTCCEGQGTRLIGTLPEYIYSIAPDGLYVDLFAPSEIAWQQDKQTLKAQMITGFPFDNNVALRFSLAIPVAAKIRVRVPAWSCKPMAIRINDTLEATGVPGTYATLDRTWKNGDSITFTLPAELRLTKYVGKEASQAQPRYALEYGPVLMAAVGASTNSPQASFSCDSATLLSRIKPVAGQPLQFSIEGESSYSYIPYWEVAVNQTFTCFPIVAEKQSALQ